MTQRATAMMLNTKAARQSALSTESVRVRTPVNRMGTHQAVRKAPRFLRFHQAKPPIDVDRELTIRAGELAHKEARHCGSRVIPGDAGNRTQADKCNSHANDHPRICPGRR